MKWVRIMVLTLIGVCVGLSWQELGANQVLATADSSYRLSLKMVNEDDNNQSAFSIISPLTNQPAYVLDKTITVKQLPDSATTYQDVLDEYAKENPTETANATD